MPVYNICIVSDCYVEVTIMMRGLVYCLSLQCIRRNDFYNIVMRGLVCDLPSWPQYGRSCLQCFESQISPNGEYLDS